jgi:ribose 5-phosphate isomerase A
MDSEIAKQRVAEKSLEFVEDGMILGLGTGSTVDYALEKLAELIRKGEIKKIVGIPTSLKTENKAKEF